MTKIILIAGPCVVESKAICFQVAEFLAQLKSKYSDHLDIVFKSSYKKANRSSLHSFTGLHFDEALRILSEVKKNYQLPLLTDVHEQADVNALSEIVDYLQIPAFLCRQTELLLACGKSDKWVNIKKGQFSSAQSMQFAIEKVRSTGNKKIMLTERGNSFGYQDLVVDFRNIPIMQNLGVPVILDATHALQMPNQPEGVTGGTPQYIETLCKAGIAIGVDGLFIETHPHPENALSDGKNMLPLGELEKLIEKILPLKQAISHL